MRGWLAILLIATAGAEPPPYDVGAPVNLVTEEEYAEREAARPPIPPAVDTGTKVCRTGAELVKAVAEGGDIWLPAGTDAVLTQPLALRKAGTTIRGPGPALAKIRMADSAPGTDRVIYPQAPDLTISGVTIHGGRGRVKGVAMDGASRGADRLTIERVTIESVSDGVYLDGAAVADPAAVLEDFTLRDSRIVDFTHDGVVMAWEMVRPRFERLFVQGKGADTSSNAMWLGLGIVDASVVDCIFRDVSRNGLEIFYPHTAHMMTEALVTRNNPHGSTVTVSRVSVANTGGIGISIAGCKRATVSDINVRNANGIGVEFIYEDSGPSMLAADGVKVFNTAGVGVAASFLKGARFSNLFVDGMTTDINGAQLGMQVYYSDAVTVTGSTFTGCGPRYLFCNNSTRVDVVDNVFLAKTDEMAPAPDGGNWAFYAYGGSVFFSRNSIRGHATNPLRTACNGAKVYPGPVASAVSSFVFTDSFNLRK